MDMSLKMPLQKKDLQSEHDREHIFNKSQGRNQAKHLSNILANSLGNKEANVKKNGHAHTYTYLNDLDS